MRDTSCRPTEPRWIPRHRTCELTRVCWLSLQGGVTLSPSNRSLLQSSSARPWACPPSLPPSSPPSSSTHLLLTFSLSTHPLLHVSAQLCLLPGQTPRVCAGLAPSGPAPGNINVTSGQLLSPLPGASSPARGTCSVPAERRLFPPTCWLRAVPTSLRWGLLGAGACWVFSCMDPV